MLNYVTSRDIYKIQHSGKIIYVTKKKKKEHKLILLKWSSITC